ncbi:MAG: hypothetical protein IJT44_00060 [Clostridia bacterium]|nr:hypothetical protein [Clostridia bacterium]
MLFKRFLKKEKKPLEFSKIIVVLTIIMWLTVNIFGMVMMAITRNLSPMVYIIASVDAVMAVIVTFYSRKACAENVIKLKSLYGIDVTEIMMDKVGTYNKNKSDHYYDDGDTYDDDSGPMWEDTSIVG